MTLRAAATERSISARSSLEPFCWSTPWENGRRAGRWRVTHVPSRRSASPHQGRNANDADSRFRLIGDSCVRPAGWWVRAQIFGQNRADRPFIHGQPHRRSRRCCLRFRGRSDRASSFDTRLAQDAIGQPSCVFLRVNGHPDLFARDRVFQQSPRPPHVLRDLHQRVSLLSNCLLGRGAYTPTLSLCRPPRSEITSRVLRSPIRGADEC